MRALPPAVVPAAALSKEWLLGNGLGDISSGTASGAHVREFHAHLSVGSGEARLAPLLLKLDGRVTVQGHTYDLSWRAGDPHARATARAEIESFSRDPWPTWRYRTGETTIEKLLLLLRDRHALIAIFRHRSGPPARLAVTPVFAHAETADPLLVQSMPGRVRTAAGKAHLATLWHDGTFLPARAWQHRLDAAADAASALDPHRRGAVVGFIESTLAPGEALHVIAAGDEALLRGLAQQDRLGTPPPRSLALCVAVLEADERARAAEQDRASIEVAEATAREAHAARHPEAAPDAGAILGGENGWVPRLARAMALGRSGPHRFGALASSAPHGAASAEGSLRAVRALITLRDVEGAREVLLRFGQLVRDGLAPSGFDPDGRPRYGSAAASLWLVIATELFARRAGEHEFVLRALYPSLQQVIERFRSGAGGHTRVEDDGLLASGEGEAASKRADLNALWYSAQAALGQLARSLGQKQSGAFYIAWAHEHQARFNEALWDEEAGGLYVALAGGRHVRGVEPSQVLAASLSPPLLPPERARTLLGTLERELRTPAGLREAPGSSRILTEWAGPFFSAWVRAHGRAPDAQRRVRGWMAELGQSIDAHAAGHVPVGFEIATDAAVDDAPMHYVGDPVSLVASAELLRFWVEELDHDPAESGASRLAGVG